MDPGKVEKFKRGRLKLQRNASLIIQHVTLEDVIDSLYSNINDLHSNTVWSLLKEGDSVSKMRQLLVLLDANKEEDVYEWFHKALVDVDTVGCDEVASILERTEITGENICNSKQELMKREVIGVGSYIKDIGINYNDNFQLEYNKNYNSSANLTGDSMKEFVPFVLKKKTNADKFKDIPVYIGLSICNFKPRGMPSDYERYSKAMNILQERIGGPVNQEIEYCIDQLLQYEIKGYEPVVIIAQQMFEECNLGRIVTWFHFWRKFASSIEGSSESLEFFCQYIGFYLHELPSYQEWAKKGWDDMVKQAKKEESYFSRIGSYLIEGFIWVYIMFNNYISN